VVPSLAQVELPFRASIDRYGVGEFLFGDCCCCPLILLATQRDSAREVLIVRHVLLPIACRTPSSKGSKARSCLVVPQAPKESVWNSDLLCD
jgi:hypothetical protein